MSKKLIIPLIVLLVAAGLLFAIAGHWTEWEGHRSEQQTDDAYLRADMTPLSTRIRTGVLGEALNWSFELEQLLECCIVGSVLNRPSSPKFKELTNWSTLSSQKLEQVSQQNDKAAPTKVALPFCCL